MTRAFQGFKGQRMASNLVWQEVNTLFPFTCDVCRREFPKGGPRYIASSIADRTHSAKGCHCEDCHAGRNPLRKPAPKYAERRTELD